MGCRVSDVSDWQASDCQSGHQSIGGHHVEFWCERSGYVSDAPLGLSFNGSLWFRWQLQNCGLLALTQCCQKHRAAVRKFPARRDAPQSFLCGFAERLLSYARSLYRARVLGPFKHVTSCEKDSSVPGSTQTAMFTS